MCIYVVSTCMQSDQRKESHGKGPGSLSQQLHPSLPSEASSSVAQVSEDALSLLSHIALIHCTPIKPMVGMHGRECMYTRRAGILFHLRYLKVYRLHDVVCVHGHDYTRTQHARVCGNRRGRVRMHACGSKYSYMSVIDEKWLRWRMHAKDVEVRSKRSRSFGIKILYRQHRTHVHVIYISVVPWFYTTCDDMHVHMRSFHSYI